MPGVGVEPTRLSAIDLKSIVATNYTTRALKYNMAPKRELDLVNRMLASIPQRYEDQHLQMLYERGYIVGLLARLAYEDSAVRDAIINKIKELEQS